MKIFRNSNGFTLVEAVMGMGMMTLSVLAGMGLMDYLVRGQTDMQAHVSTRDLMDEMRNALGISDTCEANFQGRRVDNPGPPPTQLRSFDSTVLYQTTGRYEKGSLQIVSFSFGTYTPLTDLRGRLDLNVQLRKLARVQSAPLITRRVPLIITLDSAASRRIDTCYAMGAAGADPRQTCEDLGGRLESGLCLFPSLVATADSALNSTTALLHVRDGMEDILTVLPDGRVALNYRTDGGGSQPTLPAPPTANTRLYVNGDVRVTGLSVVDRILTTNVTSAPAAKINDYATNPNGPYYSTPPYVPMVSFSGPPNTAYGETHLRFETSTGNAIFGEWIGQPVFDGGADGVVHITNSGEVAGANTGGTMIALAPQPDASQFPNPPPLGNTPATQGGITMMNDGRVGVGFSIESAHYAPMPPSGPATMNSTNFPLIGNAGYRAHNYENVTMFTRDSARFEKESYVGGYIFTAAGWTVPSDRRWKMDIQPIRNVDRAISDISGVYHRWKSDPNRANLPDGRDIGFIAQEVEKHFPEAIKLDAAGYRSVNYEKLLPVLWEAFKDRYQRNQDLKRRISRLKSSVCRGHAEEAICQNLPESQRH